MILRATPERPTSIAKRVRRLMPTDLSVSTGAQVRLFKRIEKSKVCSKQLRTEMVVLSLFCGINVAVCCDALIE